MEKFNLAPVENEGKRVLTTAQLAKAYGTDSKIISNNFNRNKERYIEGVHFYRLTGDDLRAFKGCHQIDDNLKFAPFIILWTERGALLHAKSLNTEKAWEVYEFLVDNYFRTKEMIVSNNELSVQIIGKLELLERKIDMLEKRQSNLRQYVKKEFVHIRKDIREIFDDSLGKNNQTMIPALIFINNDVKRTVKNLISYYFER